MGDSDELGPAARRRASRFAERCAELEAQGYVRHDLTVDVGEAARGGTLLVLPLVAVLVVAYVLLAPSFDLRLDLLACLGLTVALTVVHELLHGITAAAFVPGHLGAVEFGVIWSQLTPYCAVLSPMRRWQYVTMAAMPTVAIGLVLGTASVAGGSLTLLLATALLILGGAGDAYVIYLLLGCRPDGDDAVFLDHPTDVGLVAFWR